MAQQYSLLIRPHPLRMEGPRGYLQRLGQENFINFRDLELLGLDYHLETLIQNGLMPESSIDPGLHEYVGQVAGLWQHRSRVWNGQNARFCPHCLADDPYWRIGWELYFHDACPKHQVWLIDRCSSCNQELRWNRDFLLRCPCGADLRQEKSAACPEHVASLSEILANKAILNSSEPEPPPLAPLDVQQAQQLIRYVGTHLRPGTGKKPLKLYQSGSMAVSWPISSFAAEVFARWPQSFHQLLDQVQSHQEIGGRSLTQRLGQIYRYMYVGLKGNAFKPIRTAFEEWLVSTWKGGLARRNRRLLETILQEAQWIPAKIAGDILGVSTRRLESLIRIGVLEGETILYESGRRFTTVRKDSLERITAYLTNGLDLKSAAEVLGLSKRRMRGVLKLLFPNASKSVSALSSPWYVPLNDIDAVMAIRNNLPIVAIPDEGCVSVNHILRYFCWSEVEIVGLIEAAQKGELQPVAIQDGAKGISGVIFHEAQIRLWRDKHNRGLGAWLSIAQTAQLLGIHQQAAYDLVNLGFIETVKVPRVLGGGNRVSRLAIEQFQKDFVIATEISAKWKTSSRKVQGQLAKEGINPISGPRVDAGRQTIYIRYQVERFLGGNDFPVAVGKSEETGKRRKDGPSSE